MIEKRGSIEDQFGTMSLLLGKMLLGKVKAEDRFFNR